MIWGDKRLPDKDPDRYDSDLARSYNNVGGVYKSCEHYDEAEKMILSAIEIYEQLSEKSESAREIFADRLTAIKELQHSLIWDDDSMRELTLAY